MATIKVCDFCKGHPSDYDAKSGGDVRAVTLDIQGGDTSDSVERRTFDVCAPCRTRLLGEILDNISARPPRTVEPSSSSALELFRVIAEENAKERAKQPKRNIPIPAEPWIPNYPMPRYPAHPPYWSIYPPTVGDPIAFR